MLQNFLQLIHCFFLQKEDDICSTRRNCKVKTYFIKLYSLKANKLYIIFFVHFYAKCIYLSLSYNSCYSQEMRRIYLLTCVRSSLRMSRDIPHENSSYIILKSRRKEERRPLKIFIFFKYSLRESRSSGLKLKFSD